MLTSLLARLAPWPRRRTLAALPLAALTVCLGGRLTADGVLAPDGTGTLSLSWKAQPGATEASQRPLLAAPGVTVESLAVAADRTVSAKLAVSDLAGIGKTTLLKGATVTRTIEGDAGVLTIVHKNPSGRAIEDKTIPGPKYRIILPGRVLEANEKAVVDGSTVQWSFPLAEWSARPTWTLTARYELAKGATAPTGVPAPSAPAGAPAASGPTGGAEAK